MSSPRTLLRRARRLTIDLVASVFPGVDKRPLEDRVEWRDGTSIRRVTDEAAIRGLLQEVARNRAALSEPSQRARDLRRGRSLAGALPINVSPIGRLAALGRRMYFLPSDLVWAVLDRLDRRPLHERLEPQSAGSIIDPNEIRRMLEESRLDPDSQMDYVHTPEFLATPRGRAVAAIEKKNRRPWWRGRD